MADGTTGTSWWDTLANLGGGLAGYFTNQAAMQNAANQMAQGYGQAGNIMQQSLGQAQQYAMPYTTMGEAMIPYYMQTAMQAGQPLGWDQYAASPEYAAARMGQQTGAEDIAAQAAARGSYGGGAMANALQQNAMKAMMQGYGSAADRELQRQQAAVSAAQGPVGYGQQAAQWLGNQAAAVAAAQADLAQAQGALGYGTAAGQGVATNQLMNTLFGAAKDLPWKDWFGTESTPWMGYTGVIEGYDPRAYYGGAGVGPLNPNMYDPYGWGYDSNTGAPYSSTADFEWSPPTY